jgi:hypothetical protein
MGTMKDNAVGLRATAGKHSQNSLHFLFLASRISDLAAGEHRSSA